MCQLHLAALCCLIRERTAPVRGRICLPDCELELPPSHGTEATTKAGLAVLPGNLIGSVCRVEHGRAPPAGDTETAAHRVRLWNSPPVSADPRTLPRIGLQIVEDRAFLPIKFRWVSYIFLLNLTIPAISGFTHSRNQQ